MNGNEKFADEMRDAVKGMMEADPYYSDIPIITERLQDIESKIEQTVGRAGGLCIILLTVSFGGVIVNVPGANFDGIRFVARTFENVKTNPTGKTALAVALYTAAFWSQIKPDALSATLKLDEPAVSLGNDPRFLTWDTNALTSGGTKIDIPQLDPVAIDASNPAAIAASHPTFGAGIFYTLDGTFPAPRNPAAQLYFATFNAAPGTKIRARAWLPGYIPSVETKITV